MSSTLMFLASATSTIGDGVKAACGTGANAACNNVELKTIFVNISTTLTYIIGAVSVIMIIVGGLRYVISRGDPGQVKIAKDTILYAVMGVVVAIAAYAIVQFVATSIGATAATTKSAPAKKQPAK